MYEAGVNKNCAYNGNVRIQACEYENVDNVILFFFFFLKFLLHLSVVFRI